MISRFNNFCDFVCDDNKETGMINGFKCHIIF